MEIVGYMGNRGFCGWTRCEGFSLKVCMTTKCKCTQDAPDLGNQVHWMRARDEHGEVINLSLRCKPTRMVVTIPHFGSF